MDGARSITAMVEFEAYAADCRVYGSVSLGDARLTDLLNAASEVLIRDARLTSLADDHEVAVPELTVALDELYAVVASGPRGDAARRVRTRMTRVRVELGPYHVEGTLHGLPAGDPLGMVLRRPAWVPLTDVRITYGSGPAGVTDEVPTLLINRELASSMRAVEGEAGVLRWEAANPQVGAARAAEPARRADQGDAGRDRPAETLTAETLPAPPAPPAP